jgi:hypothetical protein
MLVMLLLTPRRSSRPFSILFLLLFAYELAELSFIYFAINVFRPEVLPDQVIDICVGMLGGLAAWFVCGRWRLRAAGVQNLRVASEDTRELQGTATTGSRSVV